MILLDTNVISELMRREPHPAVVRWVAGQNRRRLCTATLVRAEILFGIEMLPPGRRRDELAALAEEIFEQEFAGRLLPFDGVGPAHYAHIGALRRRTGRPIDALDALIAATALSFGTAIATRDRAGFEGLGLEVVNPWEA